jgi:hypothetical protein
MKNILLVLSVLVTLVACEMPTGSGPLDSGKAGNTPVTTTPAATVVTAEMTPFVGTWYSADSGLWDDSLTTFNDSTNTYTFGGLTGQKSKYTNQTLILNANGTGKFTANVQLQSYDSSTKFVAGTIYDEAYNEFNYTGDVKGGSWVGAPVWNVMMVFTWSVEKGVVKTHATGFGASTVTGELNARFFYNDNGQYHSFGDFHGKTLWTDLTTTNTINSVSMNTTTWDVTAPIAQPSTTDGRDNFSTEMFSITCTEQVWIK